MRIGLFVTGLTGTPAAEAGDAVLAGPWRTWCRGWKGRLRGVPLPLVSGLEITFPLVFNEGGAKSDVWRPIITGVFGVPSTLIKDRTGHRWATPCSPEL